MNPPEPEDAAPLVPRYGERSLAEVVPSLLAALGAPGVANRLEVPPARGACVLLVDGLGWELLSEHPHDAPFLHALAAGTVPLTVGFPATTATSITSLSTGRPPGEHGIVGYSFAPDREHGLLNALSWQRHGVRPPTDLLDVVVPESLQPLPSLAQRATEAGIGAVVAAPRPQRRSGLTRAALRDGDFRGTHALGDLAATALAALESGEPALCYAYHGDLDLLGHVHGPGSRAWRMQLSHVDHLVATLAEALPEDCVLAVVADHGMVPLADADRVDADAEPALAEGVELLGGEVRVRHVYARPGARDDVLAAWRTVLGDRAWVLEREEAIAAGWFGPTVRDGIRARIGDVVAAARGGAGIVRTAAEPRESAMRGHHGSLTSAEQLVPLLLHGGR